MSRDPAAAAARVVRKSTAMSDDPLPADLEAAWEAWRGRVQQVDERVVSLLRAAFEAGAEAGGKLVASEHGRRAGKKGGAARAKSLSKAKRSAIARKAAQDRWKKEARKP